MSISVLDWCWNNVYFCWGSAACNRRHQQGSRGQQVEKGVASDSDSREQGKQKRRVLQP